MTPSAYQVGSLSSSQMAEENNVYCHLCRTLHGHKKKTEISTGTTGSSSSVSGGPLGWGGFSWC